MESTLDAGNSPCKLLSKAFVQLQDAVVVQVVIVVVTNDHKVDVRQLWIIQTQGRLHHSPAVVAESAWNYTDLRR